MVENLFRVWVSVSYILKHWNKNKSVSENLKYVYLYTCSQYTHRHEQKNPKILLTLYDWVKIKTYKKTNFGNNSFPLDTQGKTLIVAQAEGM